MPPRPFANDPDHETLSWQFFTNHLHVLLAIRRDPDARQRDIAALVGITEGAVQRIVGDLEDEGYLRHERVGRRNRYEVIGTTTLRHPLEDNHSIGELLDLLEK